MLSEQHQQKIEEIDREIKSRGMNWKTKKNFPVWLHKENNWGLIDVVGFKKETSKNDSESKNEPAIIEGYEIEEASGSLQKKRNLEKLKNLEFLYNPKIKVFTCQLTSEQNHKEVCSFFNKNGNLNLQCKKNYDGNCIVEKTERKEGYHVPKGRLLGIGW